MRPAYSQLSYSRYWEGMIKWTAVTSNWTSAAAHAMSFVKDTPQGRRSFSMSAQEAAKKGGTLEASQFFNDTTDQEVESNATFYYDMIHLVSLLHAVVSPCNRLMNAKHTHTLSSLARGKHGARTHGHDLSRKSYR